MLQERRVSFWVGTAFYITKFGQEFVSCACHKRMQGIGLYWPIANHSSNGMRRFLEVSEEGESDESVTLSSSDKRG